MLAENGVYIIANLNLEQMVKDRTLESLSTLDPPRITGAGFRPSSTRSPSARNVRGGTAPPAGAYPNTRRTSGRAEQAVAGAWRSSRGAWNEAMHLACGR